jgi:glycosyltransferase involved in cell wall biosynthesis
LKNDSEVLFPHLSAKSDASRVEFWARRLSATPLIFIAQSTDRAPLGPMSLIAPRVGGRRIHALLMVAWSLENPQILEAAISAYRRHALRFPSHRLTFLTNTVRETELLDGSGIPTFLCNHNILVDESVFGIDSDRKKEFDAIYVAVMNRYKRHALCRDVPRVALIYYDLHTRSEDGYFAELKASLPDALFVNEHLAAPGYARPIHARAQALVDAVLKQERHVNLSPAQVAAWINRSCVGLCLSQEEGAMRASMEYLLCGVPVVSTQNRGGRDFFFESDYCSTVEADPQAIARAVAELPNRTPSREEIRARTLEKVAQVRALFRDVVEKIFEEEGVAPWIDPLWQRFFTNNNFWDRWTLEEFLAG